MKTIEDHTDCSIVVPRGSAVKKPAGSVGLRELQVSSFFDKSHIYLQKCYNIRIRKEIIGAFIGNLQQADILDIGCGNGALSSPFAKKGNRIVLLDFSQQMLDIARKALENKEGYEWILGNFEDWDFENQKFDVILCLGVLAHVTNVDATIGKIASLMRPKGRCILQLSDSDHPMTRLRLGYAKLRKGSERSYSYELNKTSLLEILSLCTKNGLILLDQRRYSMLVSKYRWVPDSFLYHVAKASMDIPMLSRFGSEIILFLKAI